jgi:Holliday junction resolvase
MAKTKEKAVKDSVIKILKKFNCYYFYPVSGGYGSSGVPDIIVCYRGNFIGIECKAGRGTTTPLQDRNLKAIGDAGGLTLIVNEENIDDVEDLLKVLSIGG